MSNRLLKNSAEPPLRSGNAVRMICRCAWLSVLICGMGLAASGEGEKAQANFEIHEWGGLVGRDTDNFHLSTALPLEDRPVLTLPEEVRSMEVDEPIIYVHSKDKKSFSLRVTFASGTPTITYPVAKISGNVVAWPQVQFGRLVQEMKGDAPCVNAGAKNIQLQYKRRRYEDHGAPLGAIMPVLNDVDADELIYGGQTTRFLFYEGETRYHNAIIVDHGVGAKTVTVHNSGSDTVYDVMVVVGPEKWVDSRSRIVSVGRVQELKAGEKLSLSLVPLKNGVSLVPSLIALGFTDKEAVSFEKVWKDPFLQPGYYSGSINLIYRLGQEQCGTITELEFDPKPDKIIRAFYVLVRSSPRTQP